jgi:hypothetical protein
MPRVILARTRRAGGCLVSHPAIALSIAKIHFLHSLHKHFIRQIALLSQQLPHGLTGKHQRVDGSLQIGNLIPGPTESTHRLVCRVSRASDLTLL